MKSLAAEERIAWLLTELRAVGSVSLASASERLGVSEMTIRRDLRAIEDDGQARRVRGGAVFVGPVSFTGRDRSHGEQKQAIAAKLLDLVPSSGVIALDSSTTMYRLATLMPSASDLTIVTNSMLTLQVLQDKPGITALLTGGRFDRRSDSLVGTMATSNIADFTFVRFFASASTIDEPSGCFEATIEEAEIKRAFARSAEQVIVGVDTAKLDRRAAAASVRHGQIGVLATEVDPEDERLRAYREAVPVLI
ncbi:DeoR/GlpR family DNA-binding transcription regulator [Microbacterium sp. NPDC056234]|uniref:DeoR/GlpR family DNA-binding transcription regulator n=1 Tax=Microbacterium sp. NPDC056234 TaxID=3345757 RepID=UPI0035DFF1D9